MKPKFINVQNTLLAFPTPIRQHMYPNAEPLNAELSRRIIEMREQSPGIRKSNVGGWHSDDQLLQSLGEPYGTQLGKMFLENIKAAMSTIAEGIEGLPSKVNMHAWANVNRRGDSNVAHIHPGFTWSGVYYVATDTSPDAGGELVFADPRTAALMVAHPFNPFPDANNVTVNPRPGMLLVFPSFLYHSVRVYNSDSVRISIAFNLK